MMRVQRCSSSRTNAWNSSGEALGVSGTPCLCKRFLDRGSLKNLVCRCMQLVNDSARRFYRDE
jgi:hypothetical protein